MKNSLNNALAIQLKLSNTIKNRKYVFAKCGKRYLYNSNNTINNIKLFTYDNKRDVIRGVVGTTCTTTNRTYFSTFIKNVIEQVKKDMKENKQYQEALKELKEKTEIDNKTLKIKTKINDSITFFQNIKEKNIEAAKLLYNDINNFFIYCFSNYYILKVSKKLTANFFLLIKNLLITTKNKLIELNNKWNDNNVFVELDNWRKEMALKRNKKNNIKSDSNNSKNVGKSENDKLGEDEEVTNLYEEIKKINEKYENNKNINEDNTSSNNELILSYESAWERFGSKLKDMPFLNNFFENPLLGKLFGETELAAALREMKLQDKNFKLAELIYLFEYIISKHIVQSYLNGDEETLRLHCGESAYKALHASIYERKKKKVYLDKNVLIYKNYELKGAQRMEESAPWFIFTFHTQQINCLKDKNDNIIQGQVDDIREVVYTIALSKHPEPEKEGLLYPYVVREFAIIGNTPSW
ncbi:mitochondrial import inner membrane translocase subunit TIM44, putative [Hepatocystis sp. ex Piliocolobus tephrosceles]|nr:mitochondrial import inner membrane translocase subunit TIM44, putative [Hepatocystis sp. ex Piliocolobus tephrosceles]